MTAARVLQVARQELGTVERPPKSNRQRYGDAYGMPGVAWCAQFVWWVFREAGVGVLIPKTAYTPTFADWFRRRSQWGRTPRLGSVVFFDFPNDGVNRISHVGIVEAVNRDGTVQTIEGNTSPGGAGSQRDGGGVWRRTRRAGIVGYGYPAYTAAPRVDHLLRDLRLTTPNMTGEDVAVLQRRCNAAYPAYSSLVLDGVFGPAVDAVVREFQRRSGLTVDGIVGDATRRALKL